MYKILLGALVFCFCIAQQAVASEYDVSLYFSGNTNTPYVTLLNSSEGHSLASFSMTIGDESAAFDYTNNYSTSSALMTVTGSDDHVNGGWYDTISFAFTGFDANNFFTFVTDIDSNGGNTVKNYSSVLFNNGDSVLNSLLTFVFMDGTVITSSLTDSLSGLPVYAFNYSADAPASTPIPGAALLLGSGLVGLVGLRRRMTV